MPTMQGRRGVLMTATARKPRAAWRDQQPEPDASEGDDSDGGDSDGSGAQKARASKASQLEWEELEREVRDERRRKHAESEFTMGRREGGAAVYDDAVADHIEPEERPRSRSASRDPYGGQALTSTAASQESSANPFVPVEGPSNRPADDDDDLPRGVVTAGRGDRKKERGGRKVAERKRKREEDADMDDETREAKRKKQEEAEEEEAKKWVKVRLQGDQKPKRIKVARIVHYHDHDATAAASAAAASRWEAAPCAKAGNFRAVATRIDLWGADSSDEG